MEDFLDLPSEIEANEILTKGEYLHYGGEIEEEIEFFNIEEEDE